MNSTIYLTCIPSIAGIIIALTILLITYIYVYYRDKAEINYKENVELKRPEARIFIEREEIEKELNKLKHDIKGDIIVITLLTAMIIILTGSLIYYCIKTT